MVGTVLLSFSEVAPSNRVSTINYNKRLQIYERQCKMTVSPVFFVETPLYSQNALYFTITIMGLEYNKVARSIYILVSSTDY